VVPCHAAPRAKAIGKPHSLYKSIVGKTVLVPASEFGIDVPELFYKARIIKKDPSHPRAVVVRFPDDGNLCWLPVDQVTEWLQVRQQFTVVADRCLLHLQLWLQEQSALSIWI
jgi:hypothetical protein